MTVIIIITAPVKPRPGAAKTVPVVQMPADITPTQSGEIALALRAAADHLDGKTS